MEKEKFALFIDSGYLNKILRNVFHISKIDYLKLSNKISDELNLVRLRTYYYTCMPIIRAGNKNSEDILRKSNFQKFLTNLKRLPRFEVKLGKLQLIAGQFKQKMIDVLMSLDIATMSYENQVQHVLLIAGDADFIPAIKKAKDYGIIVHLFYHPSSVHTELLDEVDELHEIKQDLIDACLIKED
jgi:uncharacterized LabA/DUF88 family protein